MPCRTIHGMVYNAMKLFMEINPQLFDDCSHNYTEDQSTAEEREANRRSQWDKISELAKQKQLQNGASVQTPRGPKVNPPERIEEVDPMTQDSQQRLDALKLQDENGNSKESASVST